MTVNNVGVAQTSSWFTYFGLMSVSLMFLMENNFIEIFQPLHVISYLSEGRTNRVILGP